jgi:hypothetical protein
MNGERVTALPLPVEQAIHWKPLRDAHYILASLEPGHGGRREIVIRQSVLASVQTLMRSGYGRRVAGILLGRLLWCPVTGADYEMIEAYTDHSDTGKDDLLSATGRLLEVAKQRHGAEVLGWYCGAPTLGPKPTSDLVAVHRSYFRDPWQTMLVVAPGASSSDGTMFLYDDTAARWFSAPFYELPDRPPETPHAKPTCIAWPQYLTMDTVVLVQPGERTPPLISNISPASSDVHSVALDDRVHHPRPPEPPAPPSSSLASSNGGLVPRMERVADESHRLTPDAPPDIPTDEVRDIATELLGEHGGDASGGPFTGHGAIVDEHRAVSGKPRNPVHPISHTGGTAWSGAAGHLIEQARGEGFAIVASFASVARTRRAETLWVLADSRAGILLIIAGTGTTVLDATLHYNLHADEAELLRTAFPEHRDLASRTIYVRETCLDRLPTRCRWLRETARLEREWKVSPAIYLLTPGEWRPLTGSHPDPAKNADRIQTVNRERILALPDAIRRQFGLTATPSPGQSV